jgi:hypothetical protein
MSDPHTTGEEIKAALRTIEGMNVASDDPKKMPTIFPSALVGLPELEFEGISSLPTGARFPVALMVPDNAASAQKLLKLIPSVVQAIRDLVVDAEIPPGSVFPAVIEIGTTQLPGYMILVEV